MNAGMKMLMLTNARNGRSGGRVESPDSNYDRMGYDATAGSYEAESRFRDRRGRDHYDNGRFAPRIEMGYGEMERSYGRAEMGGGYDQSRMEMGHPPFQTSVGGGERMNQIGFRAEPEIESGYTMSAGYQSGDEMERRESSYSMGRGEFTPRLTKETAEKWAKSMENEDGTKGPHWTMEQTKQVMAQRGLGLDPIQFWIAMNAMYSDYGKVFKKHGVGDKIDIYVDMAKAFIEDKDAQPEKLSRYYEYVVKH